MANIQKVFIGNQKVDFEKLLKRQNEFFARKKKRCFFFFQFLNPTRRTKKKTNNVNEGREWSNEDNMKRNIRAMIIMCGCCITSSYW